MTAAIRFWTKVDRPNGPLDPGPCWTWTAARMPLGYGSFDFESRTVLAHRWAYAWFYGEPIKHGMLLDHTCRNRACVNPWHLREVTHRTNSVENSRSIPAANAVKTHCPNGHPYNRVNANGRRICT